MLGGFLLLWRFMNSGDDGRSLFHAVREFTAACCLKVSRKLFDVELRAHCRFTSFRLSPALHLPSLRQPDRRSDF